MPTSTFVHKFGHNQSVAATYEPVCAGGFWPTPQVGSVTPLRVKAGGNANDTAAGSGAREITLVGLDVNGREATETLVTAGASASAASSTSFLRLYRAFVSASGTYATSTVGSHAGDIIIENAAGTEDWCQIIVNAYPHSQSQIGTYTVQMGKRAFIHQLSIEAESNKTVDFLLIKRENIMQTAAPYSAARVQQEFIGVSGLVSENFKTPLGPFPAFTDIGFISRVSTSTASVSVDFLIELEG